MELATFNSLCKKFGEQDLAEDERWKSIKGISFEGSMEPIDFEKLYNIRRGYFIDDDATIGAGFIIMEEPYAEFGVVSPGFKKKIVTFIGLDEINAISFRSDDKAFKDGD